MADSHFNFRPYQVRAALEGRLSQARQIIRKRAALDALALFGAEFLTLPGNIDLIGYAPGDRLWVREAFWTCEQCGHRNMCEGGANHSGHIGRWCCASCDELLPRAKTSPIFMPRRASRLTLTVTDVRVQRLQEISEADAVAEGAIWHDGLRTGHSGWRHDASDGVVFGTAGASFRHLWGRIHPSIIKRSPGSSKGNPAAWDANPWVAAYTFTVQLEIANA